jgi:hypothetical protein
VKIASTIGRIAAVLATVSALTALAAVAQAGTSKPPIMSKSEQTLILRGEALNKRYGLGAQSAVPQGATAAEYRALILRGEALNKRYGLGAQYVAAVTSHPTSSTRGFAWGAFGIGAAVMFGLALLTGGFFARRQLPALRELAPRHRTT